MSGTLCRSATALLLSERARYQKEKRAWQRTTTALGYRVARANRATKYEVGNTAAGNRAGDFFRSLPAERGGIPLHDIVALARCRAGGATFTHKLRRAADAR